MVLKTAFFLLPIIIAAKMATGLGYPQIDNTSYWTVNAFGWSYSEGAYLKFLCKYVKTSPTQSTLKTVCNDVEVTGVIINNTAYHFSAANFQNIYTDADYKQYYGEYLIEYLPQLKAQVYFTLYKNGEFYFDGFLLNADGSWYNAAAYMLTVKLQYDFAPSQNNIAEFAWKNAKPAQNQSPLTYIASVPGDLESWDAVKNEVIIKFPAMYSDRTDYATYNTYGRIVNAVAQGSQFGAILFPNGVAVDLAFKAKSTTYEIVPTVNPAKTIQTCGENSVMSPYG